MIKTVVAGVDSAKYIYDTGLTFGADLGAEVLNKALTALDMFERRYNYSPLDDPKQLTKTIGATKTRELFRRFNQTLDRHKDQKIISFTQHFFPKTLGDALIQTIPPALVAKLTQAPSPMLQVSKEGDYLAAHKGHKRSASLFMLLQGAGQETHWYRETTPFDTIDPLRIPDLDKIEHVVTAVIEPFKWYVFNHFEWHSVHNFSTNSIRVNMGLDFDNISAEELCHVVQGAFK